MNKDTTEKAASAGWSAYTKARAAGVGKWLAAAAATVAAALVIFGGQDANAAPQFASVAKVIEGAGDGNCPTPRTCKRECVQDVCVWTLSQATAAGAAQCQLGKCETAQPRRKKDAASCDGAGLSLPPGITETSRAA